MGKDEFIRIKEWPTDYAQTAYNQDKFIEAIQVLHGFIETKLQELLILEGAKSNKIAEKLYRNYGFIDDEYQREGSPVINLRMKI